MAEGCSLPRSALTLNAALINRPLEGAVAPVRAEGHACGTGSVKLMQTIAIGAGLVGDWGYVLS